MGEPLTWLLVDDRPRNATQARGLAGALGLPFTLRRLCFHRFADYGSPLAGGNWLSRLSSATTIGVDRARSDTIDPPWPDLLIGVGARCAPVARWIRRRSAGQTRVGLLGREAGFSPQGVDLVVTPRYAALPPHPRRIETIAPLHAPRVKATRIAAGSRPDLAAAARPRIAALIGGSAGRHVLDAAAAQTLGRRLLALAHATGGSVLVTTSRRTGEGPTAALAAALAGDPAVRLFHRFGASDENPYLALLGVADAIVVTGESESMLAEAASLGRPVLIAPIPERPGRFRRRVRETLREHARRGYGGSPRRLARLAASVVSRGFVLPPRDLAALHADLVARGVARWLDDTTTGLPARVPALREVDDVAREVARRLGLPACDPAEDARV